MISLTGVVCVVIADIVVAADVVWPRFRCYKNVQMSLLCFEMGCCSWEIKSCLRSCQCFEMDPCAFLTFFV